MPPRLYRQWYTDRHGERRQSNVYSYDIPKSIAGGRRLRGSTGETDEEAAWKVLGRVLVEEKQPKPGKVTLSDLRRLLVSDYKRNGRKTADRVARRFKPLEAHFGAQRKASNITTNAVVEYADARLDEGRARATVNRELAALRRAFNIATQRDLVRRPPVIKALKERNVRTGFLEPDQFLTLAEALPRDVRTLVHFAYITGWRRGELRSRDWKHLDLSGGWLRLEPGETKNGDGRSFPLTVGMHLTLEHHCHVAKEMWGSILPEKPLFFRYGGTHRGQRIRRFDRDWKRAAKAAGKPNLLFHDLRRSAIRNIVRAGVPETVAMRLTGHRTRSVFKRYDIVDERDLVEAVERLSARNR